MKIVNLIALFLISGSAFAKEASTFPFESVVFEKEHIVATLPKSPIWIVSADSAPDRQSKPGESFILKKDSSLSIFEKHSSYSFRPKFYPDPGLDTEATIDERSFGRGVLRKSFFIFATKTEQGAAANP